MTVATVNAMVADVPMMLAVIATLSGILILLVRTIKLNKIYFLFIIFYILSYYHAEGLLQKPIIDPIIQNEQYQTEGVYAQVNGSVSQIVEKDDYVQLVLTKATVLLKIEVQQDQGNQNLSSEELCLLVNCDTKQFSSNPVFVGDVVQIKGKVKAFSAARNEGEFDSLSYYQSIGIHYKVSANKVEKIADGKDQLLPALTVIRSRLKQVYQNIADQAQAGIYASIVLGDKSDLDVETKELYQVSGIAHLLAISGLHIAIIGMTLYRILRRLGLQFLPSGFMSGMIMICYGLMTGNGISTTRAIIMFLFSIAAEITGRTYDILSAMAFSAMYLIGHNPYVIQNSGFLLSFGAIIGITLIEPAMEKITKVRNIENIWLKRFSQSLLISISINLFTLPIILYHYFQVPTYSFLLNLFVIPLMSIVMMCSVMAGLVGLFSLKAGTFVIGAAHYILNLYQLLCNCNQKLPFSTIVLGRPSIRKIIVYYLLILLLIFMIQRRKPANQNNRKLTNAVSYFILIIAILQLIPAQNKQLSIRMIDVGQGDGILIQTPEHVNYLFDGGSSDIKQVGKYRILPVIKANAVTCIDYVVMSHSDSDHISGIMELLDEMDVTFSIKNLVVPNIVKPDDSYLKLIKKAEEHNVSIIYVNTGVDIGTAKVKISCMHPDTDYVYQTANDYSANYLITYQNFDLLMTGDVEKQGEHTMLRENRYQKIDVLKVAHHGSDSSTTQEFLDICQPNVAMISCGIKNKYGHPSRETIEKLDAMGVETFVTKNTGEIMIITDGDKIQVNTFLHSEGYR